VKGEDQLSTTSEVLVSLYTPRDILPGRERVSTREGSHQRRVQKMVESEVSGVIFTLDPVNGDRRRSLLSRAGLGEALVSGLSGRTVHC